MSEPPAADQFPPEDPFIYARGVVQKKEYLLRFSEIVRHPSRLCVVNSGTVVSGCWKAMSNICGES